MKSVAPAGLSVKVLDDLAAVQQIAPEWERVLERSSAHRAFGCPAWFLATCRLEQATPHVLTAFRGSELVGVFPLLRPGRGEVVTVSRALTDYHETVVVEEDLSVAEALLLAAIAPARGRDERAAASGSQRPALHLPNVREDALCAQAARSLGLSQHMRPMATCQYIDLSGSRDDYLQTRTARFRKTLRNIKNRAAREGVTVRLLDPAEWAERLPDAFLELHFARFGEESCFSPGARRAFVAEVFPGLCRSGRLLAAGLFTRERLIALEVCLAGARSLCTYNGGFLPEAAALSPGRLLFDFLVRTALARGIREVDLLRGDQVYKTAWATGWRSMIELSRDG